LAGACLGALRPGVLAGQTGPTVAPKDSAAGGGWADTASETGPAGIYSPQGDRKRASPVDAAGHHVGPSVYFNERPKWFPLRMPLSDSGRVKEWPVDLGRMSGKEIAAAVADT
jgi:hypothetical protein